MKYFDAQTRAKTYVKSKKITELEKTFYSKDYLEVSITDRLDMFIEWLEEVKEEYKEAAAVKFVIGVEDTGEDFLDDQDVFDLMSNIATAYSRTFKRQTEKVLTPKKNILDSLPISPASIMSLTMLHIVDKPLQIVVHRNHRESDSYEQVELI